ncbi:hypothetical protein SBADM41S_10170 [Streptomyces badius]
MKIFHQPVAAMSCGPRSEDSSRPIVGISQNRATRTRKTRITPPPARAAIRAPRDCSAFGASGAPPVFRETAFWRPMRAVFTSGALLIAVPPSGSGGC